MKLLQKTGIFMLMMSLAFLLAACAEEKQTGLSEYTLEAQSSEKEPSDGEASEETASGSTKSEDGASVPVSGKEAAQGIDSAVPAQENESVTVYVCGAVLTPGVYELPGGSRVCDAVAEAGGVCEDASEISVNQARVLVDGEQIYIPTDEEISQGNFVTETAVSETGNSVQADGKVNLNTATREELMTLNGIGATRADTILLYREQNGPFRSVEELMQVDGIKEGIFEKIKDGITVN